MNRTPAAILGLVLLVAGVGLLAYRIQTGADLAEPLPVLLTVLAVGSLLGGVGTLSKVLRPGPPRKH